MGKYGRLTETLAECAEDALKLTFRDLEDILGFGLPASARKHAAWWGNHAGNPQAKGWLEGGFRVESVDRANDWVLLRRASASPPRTRGTRAMDGAPAAPVRWEPLAQLAHRRPVFHAEADLQQELAWQLRLAGWDHIRLERPFRLAEVINLDLFATNNSERLAIELKYWKRQAQFHLDGELYDLKANAAHDICRYDFWKDVVRLETLVDGGEADSGLAIALTSDANHWRQSKQDTIDREFRLHDGRVVGPGALSWAERAGAGTTKGREKVLELRGRYTLSWELFSDHPEVGPLWALVVGIGAE